MERGCRGAGEFNNEMHLSWLSAVRAFLLTVEFEDGTVADPELPAKRSRPPRGPRDPSLRLRFLVMRRDHFSCRHCGASPAKDQGVELHVDHVIPWEKGGPTTLGNLQTPCTRCNLGKSNLLERGAG